MPFLTFRFDMSTFCSLLPILYIYLMIADFWYYYHRAHYRYHYFYYCYHEHVVVYNALKFSAIVFINYKLFLSLFYHIAYISLVVSNTFKFELYERTHTILRLQQFLDWTLFKVGNEETKTVSLTQFWCL